MTIQANPTDGIFRHKCIESSCSEFVMYDDEPWCYDHSPDEGSSLPGYSAYQQEYILKIAMDAQRAKPDRE
jgi:hypothetical protein